MNTPTTRNGDLVPSQLLPPILAGQQTPTTQKKVERFYLSLEEMLERWITRRQSPHTQRAYRQDIESLLSFLPIVWPRDSLQLLTVTVADVQRWRDAMIAGGKAPKTINRRVSSVSSFFKYLQGVAAELRLPITVPNPAHAQFIARSSTDPIHETKSLSATRARQLMGMPQGEDLVAYRDRAILKWYVYSGVRLSTACKLNKGDVHVDGEETTVRISEKGDKHRTIGLHFAAADAIGQYTEQAEIKRGALFRPRTSSNSQTLANKRLTEAGMHRIVRGYLEKLPGAMVSEEGPEGEEINRCVYSTHSLRATTATLLLDAGVDICKVQELLGHRHVTTTQIYDKRRRAASDSASHDVPI
ncbi:tyrosine-type recombinase/integrase [Crateriforma conspicua]|uniref:Tyrosine recombinase XerD n=1 Tax=Crateriforma conspicua TaxID=2527996 RepID=A0A5C6FHT8_9PLAN|nr:tyrosine-type recombinase/integrase [Crateriforma conspicua]TWU59611.1 Tyrosine recombinase XerD [Crateriforma conspicua]